MLIYNQEYRAAFIMDEPLEELDENLACHVLVGHHEPQGSQSVDGGEHVELEACACRPDVGVFP